VEWLIKSRGAGFRLLSRLCCSFPASRNQYTNVFISPQLPYTECGTLAFPDPKNLGKDFAYRSSDHFKSKRAKIARATASSQVGTTPLASSPHMSRKTISTADESSSCKLAVVDCRDPRLQAIEFLRQESLFCQSSIVAPVSRSCCRAVELQRRSDSATKSVEKAIWSCNLGASSRRAKVPLAMGSPPAKLGAALLVKFSFVALMQ
jgi:hypothetical protein